MDAVEDYMTPLRVIKDLFDNFCRRIYRGRGTQEKSDQDGEPGGS